MKPWHLQGAMRQTLRQLRESSMSQQGYSPASRETALCASRHRYKASYFILVPSDPCNVLFRLVLRAERQAMLKNGAGTTWWHLSLQPHNIR